MDMLHHQFSIGFRLPLPSPSTTSLLHSHRPPYFLLLSILGCCLSPPRPLFLFEKQMCLDDVALCFQQKQFETATMSPSSSPVLHRSPVLISFTFDTEATVCLSKHILKNTCLRHRRRRNFSI